MGDASGIVWNGWSTYTASSDAVTLYASDYGYPPRPKRPQTNQEWLDERVDELRVKL